MASVGKNQNKTVIKEYVKNQGKQDAEYKQIHLALYNPESIFGIFLASYGQLPAMLCFSIGGLLLIKTADKQNKMTRILKCVFGSLLQVMTVLGITMDPMLYIKNMPLALILVIALAITAGWGVLILKVTKNADIKQLKKMAMLLIGIMFVEMLLINIIKIPWGRPRMRMIANHPEASFQPWWVIGTDMKEKLIAIGVAAEEFKSFPSGHAGNAACALLLGFMPLICHHCQGKEKVLFCIGLTFTLLVAISRIIMGAHFLSDVTVGMTITFITILCLSRLI